MKTSAEIAAIIEKNRIVRKQALENIKKTFENLVATDAILAGMKKAVRS